MTHQILNYVFSSREIRVTKSLRKVCPMSKLSGVRQQRDNFQYAAASSTRATAAAESFPISAEWWGALLVMLLRLRSSLKAEYAIKSIFDFFIAIILRISIDS